jgi:C_GCAxxG_C_C family probable redox protein
MDRVNKALELYQEGLSCSQAVFSVFADKFDLDEKAMMKIAGGFGGGIGASGLICGALSGSVMVLGLKFGASDGADTDSKHKTRELVRVFMKKFSDQFGAIDCKCLLGFDMSRQEDFDYVHNNNITRQLCPKFIEFAVVELEKII